MVVAAIRQPNMLNIYGIQKESGNKKSLGSFDHSNHSKTISTFIGKSVIYESKISLHSSGWPL